MNTLTAFSTLEFIQDQFLQWLLKIVSLGLLLGIGLLTQRIYRRYKKPEFPEIWGNLKVPNGAVIAGIILAVAIIFLVYVISRDPLEGRR